MAHLRIGSRGSQLALWQANHIKSLLQQQGHEAEIEIIHTTGDKVTDVPLAKVGTKGMFTKEIEEALAEAKLRAGFPAERPVVVERFPKPPSFWRLSSLTRLVPRAQMTPWWWTRERVWAILPFSLRFL